MGSKKTPKGKKTTAVKDLTAKDAEAVKGGTKSATLADIVIVREVDKSST